MTRGIRLMGFGALLFVAALVLFISVSDTRATPPPFNPGDVLCIEKLESAANCDGDTTPGNFPDLHTRFCVGWGTKCDTQPNIADVKDSRSEERRVGKGKR